MNNYFVDDFVVQVQIVVLLTRSEGATLRSMGLFCSDVGSAINADE